MLLTFVKTQNQSEIRPGRSCTCSNITLTKAVAWIHFRPFPNPCSFPHSFSAILSKTKAKSHKKIKNYHSQGDKSELTKDSEREKERMRKVSVCVYKLYVCVFLGFHGTNDLSAFQRASSTYTYNEESFNIIYTVDRLVSHTLRCDHKICIQICMAPSHRSRRVCVCNVTCCW